MLESQVDVLGLWVVHSVNFFFFFVITLKPRVE